MSSFKTSKFPYDAAACLLLTEFRGEPHWRVADTVLRIGTHALIQECLHLFDIAISSSNLNVVRGTAILFLTLYWKRKRSIRGSRRRQWDSFCILFMITTPYSLCKGSELSCASRAEIQPFQGKCTVSRFRLLHVSTSHTKQNERRMKGNERSRRNPTDQESSLQLGSSYGSEPRWIPLPRRYRSRNHAACSSCSSFPASFEVHPDYGAEGLPGGVPEKSVVGSWRKGMRRVATLKNNMLEEEWCLPIFLSTRFAGL